MGTAKSVIKNAKKYARISVTAEVMKDLAVVQGKVLLVVAAALQATVVEQVAVITEAVQLVAIDLTERVILQEVVKT